jgi:intracellular multiplication protein IcmB
LAGYGQDGHAVDAITCDSPHLRLWQVLAGATVNGPVEFTYLRDPEQGQRHVERVLQRLHTHGERAGLQRLDQFLGSFQALHGKAVAEEVYIALWTYPAAIPSAAQREDNKQYQRRARLGGDFRYSQHPYRASDYLINTHVAAAEQFFDELNHARIITRPLSARELLTVIKSMLSPHLVGWTPHLVGDPPSGSLRYPGPTSLLWLNIREQLFDFSEERINRTITRIDDRYYATVHLTLLPQSIVRFSHLRPGADIPFRMRFRVAQVDRLTQLHYSLKRFLAGLLNWPSHDTNNAITRAMNEIQPLIEVGDVRVLQIAATTWGGSELELYGRLEKLSAALHAWGNSQLKPVQDDPLEGVITTLPAMYDDSAGEKLIAPKHVVGSILPIDVAACPWREGVIFRTLSGMPWYFEPFSRQQAAWVEQYTGPQGYGKSVLMNMTNLQFILQSGEIPYFGLIEINPAAEGLFRLLRELALPEYKKYFLYRRLTNTARDAINPFSTFLGCREQLPPHRESLLRFLLSIAYSLDAEQPEKNTTELLMMLIDEVYAHYRDNERGHPKEYMSYVDHAVDKKLQELGLRPSTWFAAADGLFAAGERDLAILAHEYAMPLLADAAVILMHSESIRGAFGSAKTSDGQGLIEYVHQQFIAALGLFPPLTAPTRVQVGAARVIGFDLREVAPAGNSLRERRMTTVSYLLARQILTRYVLLHPDHVPYFPPLYHAYGRQVTTYALAMPKRQAYDEAHLLKGIAPALELLTFDARITRSQNGSLAFSTQLFNDLEALIELTSARFVCGVQTNDAVRAIDQTFELTEGEREALLHRIHVPDKEGSYVLAITDTAHHGTLIQELRFPCPPILLWALATYRDDDTLRARVLPRLDYLTALQALAGRFPSGSAKSELEHLQYERPELSRNDILQELADSVFAYHQGVTYVPYQMHRRAAPFVAGERVRDAPVVTAG